MTDNQPPSSPAPGWQPNPAPGPPPVDLRTYAEPDPAGPKRGGRVIVAGVGAVLVAALAMVGLASLFGSSGSASPEEAVEQLFGSLERQDAIGMMESLAPSEREVLMDPVLEMTGHLQRLGVLSEFGLDSVPGAQFDIDGLELRAVQITDDIAWVQVVGGTLTATVDPDAVPIGPVWDRFDPEIDAETETTNLADDDIALAAIRRDGGWHVSIGYTIAESVRRDAGEVFPTGTRLEPVGAGSPDEVITELVRAANELDGELALGMLDPVELEAMYEYSAMFLPFDEGEMSNDTTLEMSNLVTRVEGSGSRRRVYIEAFDLDVDTYYPTWGEREQVSMSFADGCLSFEQQWEYEDRSYGDEGWTDSFDTCDPDSFDADYGTSFEWWMGDDAGLASVLGLSMVERNGRWYLSPTRTVLDTMNEALAVFDQSDVEGWIDWFDDWDASMSPEYRFEEIGEAIDEPAAESDWESDPELEAHWEGMRAACGSLEEQAWVAEDEASTREDWDRVEALYEEAWTCYDDYERDNPLPGSSSTPGTTPTTSMPVQPEQPAPGQGTGPDREQLSDGVLACFDLLDEDARIDDPAELDEAALNAGIDSLEVFVRCVFDSAGMSVPSACTATFAWMREAGLPGIATIDDPPPEIASEANECEAAMEEAGL